MHVHVFVYASVCVCVCVCMRVCVCAYVCAWVRAHVCAYTQHVCKQPLHSDPAAWLVSSMQVPYLEKMHGARK